jgi:hypothetical protein
MYQSRQRFEDAIREANRGNRKPLSEYLHSELLSKEQQHILARQIDGKKPLSKPSTDMERLLAQIIFKQLDWERSKLAPGRKRLDPDGTWLRVIEDVLRDAGEARELQGLSIDVENVKRIGTRGRRSIAELTIVGGVRTVVTADRPDPPKTLTDAEATEWRELVASMPPDYFARTHYVSLVQLCKHTIAARHISQLIEACNKKRPFDLREYTKLLNMQLKQTAAILRLSTSMRLTHQSIYRAESAKLRAVPKLGSWHGSKLGPWNGC